MPFVFKRLALSLSIAALLAAADKDKPGFSVGPVTDYPARQTNGKVTVAVAAVVETEEQARPAFGKANPYKYGVLPVLVIIHNGSSQTLRTGGMRVDYVAPDGAHVEATSAQDVRYLRGVQRPGTVSGPLPGGIPRVSRNKNPLSAWEIEGRAWTAKMIPPGESASGFFYFQTGHRPGSMLYMTGISEAGSGQEIFYFEIPLDKVARR